MLQQSCFSEVLHEDVTVHFQLICMPKQLFVWISHGPTSLGQLCAAMPQARVLVAAEHQHTGFTASALQGTAPTADLLKPSADARSRALAQKIGQHALHEPQHLSHLAPPDIASSCLSDQNWQASAMFVLFALR